MTPLTMFQSVVYHGTPNKSTGGFTAEMKKRVTIREMKDYFSENKPREISFVSENQPWYKVSDPCKIRCTFPTILISENPNLVCLKSGCDTICFDRVKYAEVDTEFTVLGTILRLFCGDAAGESGSGASYILVVA